MRKIILAMAMAMSFASADMDICNLNILAGITSTNIARDKMLALDIPEARRFIEIAKVNYEAVIADHCGVDDKMREAIAKLDRTLESLSGY
jgi:hypothetical protein